MASLTSVLDVVELAVSKPGEKVDLAISGTYAMTIKFQRCVGSPGPGAAWQTLATYSTADATVAASFYSKAHNDVFRAIVTSDTSGTAVVTVTSTSDSSVSRVVGSDGALVAEFKDSGLAVGGGVKSGMVSLTAATYTLNPTDHANRKLVFNLAAGIDVTLPAATGTGDSYEFFVGIATTDAYLIQAAPATDGFNGVIVGVDADAEFTWGAVDAGTDDKIILGGTAQATGGTIGDWVKVTDIKAGSWSVQGMIHQGGSEATPFAAT